MSYIKIQSRNLFAEKGTFQTWRWSTTFLCPRYVTASAFCHAIREILINTFLEQHIRKSFVICATQLARSLLLKKLNYFEVTLNHGTIIPTGITCKKIPCYMRDSACRQFFVKKAKILYVKHFWTLEGSRKYRILIGLCI